MIRTGKRFAAAVSVALGGVTSMVACSPGDGGSPPAASVEDIRPIVHALYDSSSSREESRKQWCDGFSPDPRFTRDRSEYPKSTVRDVKIVSQTGDYLVSTGIMQQTDPPQLGTYEIRVPLRFKSNRWCFDGAY